MESGPAAAGYTSRPQDEPSSASAPSRPSREDLTKWVRSANIPCLLMVIYQATGDRRWLQDPYRPTKTRGLTDNDDGGLSTQIQEEIRAAAVHTFLSLGAGNPLKIAQPSPAEMTEMLSVCVGEPVAPEHGLMLAHELAVRSQPSSAISARHSDRQLQAVVVGAGVAGIIAAEQLERAGISYLIFDPHAAPGGNWRDNPYPGAGVDTPSHLYSFSFAPYDWAQHFATRAQLQEYFSYVAQSIGISRRIRFGTTVESARFDVGSGLWHLSVHADGTTEEVRVPVLISAAGVLNRPKIPDLPGRESFRGLQFHSSCWPADLDLHERNVAVVGTGASSMQIVPAIAAQVKELRVFQRTPAWVAPFEKFHRPINADHRQLLITYRHYRSWYWVKLYWQFGDKILDALRIDPDWPHPERAVNAQNDAYRRYFSRYIREELGNREDLLAKVVPDYPPFGKRILLDNGWYRALMRQNVSLVNEAVSQVTEDGLVTQSGQAFRSDVIVWATGFEATRFVASMEVEGRDGLTLRDAWNDDDPRAYLGVTVPGFPNLFLLGGPNSFPGSGSYMHSIEVQMRYVSKLLKEMQQARARFVEPRLDVFERFNRQLDAVSMKTVWAHPGLKTYYCNQYGRLVFLSPFRNIDYWDLTANSGLQDYVVTPDPG